MYSHVRLGERLYKMVKFTPVQATDLEKVLKFKGLTAQTYLHGVALQAIDTDLAEMAGRKERRKSKEEQAHKASGLGLFRAPVHESAPADPLPAPAPVVVNVGTDRSRDDLIERLAKNILSASTHERESRIRKAAAALQAYAEDESERRALMDRLNAEIKRGSEPKGDSILERLTGGGLGKWTAGILK